MALLFKDLVEINWQRSKELYPQCDYWGPMHWGGCVAGEGGEVQGATKKLERAAFKLGVLPQHLSTYDYKSDARLAPLIEAVGHEVADTVHYSALLSAHLGFDIEKMLIDKFNIVSEEKGNPLRLSNDTPAPAFNKENVKAWMLAVPFVQCDEWKNYVNHMLEALHV